MDAVKPEVAIYMAGEGNSYGHPHQQTITALAEVGAEIYGTDIHGDLPPKGIPPFKLELPVF